MITERVITTKKYQLLYVHICMYNYINMRSRQKITKGTLRSLHDCGTLSNVSPKFSFPGKKKESISVCVSCERDRKMK